MTSGSGPGAALAARHAVEGVVRDHSATVLSGLIRYLRDFDLAEEALQDALAIALERWPSDGVPRNPAAWIVTAARRRALDRLRRRATRVAKAPDLEVLGRLERDVARPDEVPEIPDERLALMFTCCHPALAQPAQVALTLRTLGGLSTGEIARSFLVAEATLAQRIVRAKRKIKQAGIPYRVPPRELLPERLDSVLSVLYLIFNEGYSATHGQLVRGDLCDEAIRLGRILVALLPDAPEARGLLALMLLQDSRRASRLRPDGSLVTLDEQDRAGWDRSKIDEGSALVRGALEERRPGPYQLQAAIAAVHAEAATAADTDWWQIVGLYAALAQMTPSPVISLNGAVALAMAAGPAAGLGALDRAELAEPLGSYHLYHAARADLLRRLDRHDEARQAYTQALQWVTNDTERGYLEQRLRDLPSGG